MKIDIYPPTYYCCSGNCSRYANDPRSNFVAACEECQICRGEFCPSEASAEEPLVRVDGGWWYHQKCWEQDAQHRMREATDKLLEATERIYAIDDETPLDDDPEVSRWVYEALEVLWLWSKAAQRRAALEEVLKWRREPGGTRERGTEPGRATP